MSTAPLALQLAVRMERTDPPTVPAVCAATALATIAMLEDERSGPDGPWHEAVSAWNGARIRKIVRRGRGSAWRRAQAVDGVEVMRDGATVRAFVPGPTDRVPPPVAKLQIQSTDQPEIPETETLPDVAGLVILVTPGVEMTWGKRAAQCAHAGHRAWERAEPSRRQGWDEAGRPLTVVHPDRALWQSLLPTAEVRIRDAGYTEIPSGTTTALALWR
ncbi:MAG: peptidyl-tRNA hydrolase [Actinomycetota bacterium]